ncbi:efflux transporter outer membrane subunit [Robbsia sp. KACC 23696]|uniref:efflux transporter outer membrane subunit n=1 Tax=Robbsia sp. KACC 23696 TaxID=3149231 RepID=UPI00325BABDF
MNPETRPAKGDGRVTAVSRSAHSTGRWARRLAPAALAVAVLGGCTVGPNYKVPPTALINQPLANRPLVETEHDIHATATVARAASADPVPNDWWKLYDDPVLNGLIEQALQRNVDLRVAAANLARASAVLNVAQAQGGFGGSLDLAAKRAQESAQQYLLTEKLPVTNESNFGLSVSYQFDLFGVLKRGVEAADANVDAVRAAGDTARITVVSQVVQAYLESCDATEQEDIALKSLDLQDQSTQLERRLRDAGRGAQPNVTRSVTQQETLRAQLPQFAAQRRIAHYTLAALLGVSPDALPKTIDACRETPRILTPLPVGDGAALLRRRPDVRRAERELAAATAKIGVAIGGLYPNITFGASAGVTGVLEDSFRTPTQRWSFGPMISWELPANGVRGRIREARAGADVSLAEFDKVVLNALRETQTRLATYAGDLGRLQALEDALTSARQSREQTHRFYLAGRESFLADLEATRTLTSVESQVAAVRGKVAQDQVAVFLALGGGWQADQGIPLAGRDAKANAAATDPATAGVSTAPVTATSSVASPAP